MQQSVRENIALPFSARLRNWGPISMRREKTDVVAAIARLQIDTRAQREVQRLSGGNQQKVTIARWIAADVRTILCFDPTRGIDVRTKQEIYRLLRELAAQGKSVLYYTSELEEVQRVCDRAIVIFGGTGGRRAAGGPRRRGCPDTRILRPAPQHTCRRRHSRGDRSHAGGHPMIPLHPTEWLGLRTVRAVCPALRIH